MRMTGVAAALVALGLSAGAACAADHKVEMKNQGANGGFMVFEPAYLAVAPGDTVTFTPTDRNHNAVSVAGMIPAGAQPFAGALNEELKVTFTQPGVYGYQCTPHYQLGMVGVIVVGPGKPANLAEAQAVEHPPKPQAAFEELLKKAAAQP